MYWAPVAPNTDLMYVFTSDAISSKPVIFLYNTSFLAIRAMLNGVVAVTTALFFVFNSLYKVERAVTFKSASFGV